MTQFHQGMLLDREPWILLETVRFLKQDAGMLQYAGVVDFLRTAWDQFLQLHLDYIEKYGDLTAASGESAENVHSHVFAESHLRAVGILRERTCLPPAGSQERGKLFATIAYMQAELKSLELQIAP
jgi:hypothetical protein